MTSGAEARVRSARPDDRDAIADLLTIPWGGTLVAAHGLGYDAATAEAVHPGAR